MLFQVKKDDCPVSQRHILPMSVIYRYFQLALFHARFQKFIPGIGGWEGGLSPGIILVTREMRELTLVTLLLVCEF